MARLLVVDDEPNIVFTVQETFRSRDLAVESAGTAKEALESVRRKPPDVVLLDVRLPDMSGLDAFDRIHALDARIPVILMTAFARTETAIEAMRRGAFDYFVKPIDLQVLREALDRAVRVSRQSHVPAVVGETDGDDPDADLIVGSSPAMQEIYKTIGRVAAQDVTVLVRGESGTGKELVARAIYHYGRRREQPFLAVNCAALSESLLESELFGHEKGAFTGADQRRIGKFEQVDGGTIFLDEIGDMTPATQAKALRLLQQQQFERVGGNATISTDVRIIAATNRDLEAMVAAGTYRQDLYYRLAGFTVRLPPLRERGDDVRELSDYFVRIFARELQKPVTGMTDEVRETLARHPWPGNVRELHSAIRYAMLHVSGDLLTVDCLPPSCRGPAVASSAPVPLPEAATADGTVPLDDVRRLVRTLLGDGANDVYHAVLGAVEQIVVEEALAATGGNQLQAAERLGISRMTLRSKLRTLRSNGTDEPPRPTRRS